MVLIRNRCTFVETVLRVKQRAPLQIAVYFIQECLIEDQIYRLDWCISTFSDDDFEINQIYLGNKILNQILRSILHFLLIELYYSLSPDWSLKLDIHRVFWKYRGSGFPASIILILCPTKMSVVDQKYQFMQRPFNPAFLYALFYKNGYEPTPRHCVLLKSLRKFKKMNKIWIMYSLGSMIFI